MSGLIVHSQQPYNAEPPLPRLGERFITPAAAFYVRCHGDIPHLDATEHTLEIGGLVAQPQRFTVAGLQSRFAHRRVTAVLQCAGNRRADLRQVAPVAGDPWAAGAIGNAEWTGVALADVLHAAGVDAAGELHVAFEAADRCARDDGEVRFGVSIPLAKALSPDVLLAWAMNGEDLAAEHGFPLRAVVPGFAGVRSAKWLTRITVQDRPSANPFQAADYKMFPPHVTAQTHDPAHGITIEAMPLNAAICVPAPGARVTAGRITLSGYAVASGRGIARVDVSCDDGANWRQAKLAPAAPPWSWTLWRAELALPAGDHVLVARAWDSAGQTQPANVRETWNYKGYLCAAWHRVPIRVG